MYQVQKMSSEENLVHICLTISPTHKHTKEVLDLLLFGGVGGC